MEPVDVAPTRFLLGQNYPNPVRDATTIAYELPAAADVTLELWDLLGRRVRVLLSGTQSAGLHNVSIDVNDLPNGTYVYRLESGSASETRRLVVAR